jgi:hypothetical protein
MKQQNGKSAGPKQRRTTSLEIETAWRKEVAGRVDEIKSGRAKLIPAEEVHRRARAALDEETPEMLAAIDEADRSFATEGGVEPQEVRRKLKSWITG